MSKANKLPPLPPSHVMMSNFLRLDRARKQGKEAFARVSRQIDQEAAVREAAHRAPSSLEASPAGSEALPDPTTTH